MFDLLAVTATSFVTHRLKPYSVRSPLVVVIVAIVVVVAGDHPLFAPLFYSQILNAGSNRRRICV